MAETRGKAPTALSMALAYGLWLMSAALSLWLVLQMRLLFLVDLPQKSATINHWAFSAIDKFGFLFLGIIWLIFLVVSEEIFRRKVGHQSVLALSLGCLLSRVYSWAWCISGARFCERHRT